VIVHDHELEPLGGGRDPGDVRQLVEQISGRRVDELDVGGIAARRPAVEHVGEQ
jgi:hypothetical protein